MVDSIPEKVMLSYLRKVTEQTRVSKSSTALLNDLYHSSYLQVQDFGYPDVLSLGSLK